MGGSTLDVLDATSETKTEDRSLLDCWPTLKSQKRTCAIVLSCVLSPTRSKSVTNTSFSDPAAPSLGPPASSPVASEPWLPTLNCQPVRTAVSCWPQQSSLASGPVSSALPSSAMCRFEARGELYARYVPTLRRGAAARVRCGPVAHHHLNDSRPPPSNHLAQASTATSASSIHVHVPSPRLPANPPPLVPSTRSPVASRQSPPLTHSP